MFSVFICDGRLQCFFQKISWIVELVISQEHNLAKFGYMLDMKVEKRKESLYILGDY
jgi:hypothetical protein